MFYTSSLAKPEHPGRRPGQQQNGGDNVEFDGIATTRGKTRQSKKIPLWLWTLLARMLGIKLAAKDKPSGYICNIQIRVPLGSAPSG